MTYWSGGSELITSARAHWIAADIIAYDGSGSVHLHHSDAAEIFTDPATGKLSGGNSLKLRLTETSEDGCCTFPHLARLKKWRLPPDIDRKGLLKQQLVVSAATSAGELKDVTSVQIRGALDAVYGDAAMHCQPGCNVSADGTSFSLWAPTAQRVEVMLYDAHKNLLRTRDMAEESASGLWTYRTSRNMSGSFYRFRVKVYHYLHDAIHTFVTTDPYSLSLSANSEFSQVVDLNDAALQPAGWENSGKDSSYVVAAPTDISIYEIHIRDFSASDRKGLSENNGKYLAFTETDRDSVTHLKALRAAGLTHIHLLPAFDFATINDCAEQRLDLSATLAEFCARFPDNPQCALKQDHRVTLQELMASFDPASGDAQELMKDLRGVDGFNWGYDPLHYAVPEGSYASDAEGYGRIVEFRAMVKALHELGFSVVMDVVFNHTHASGAAHQSVLDKIVPGYYHRLDPESGAVENSTCCNNTATESLMFQKLMEDALIVWARDYQIDGFRFDLMGHHPKQGILRALEKVRQFRSHAYFYGEGWNFGEVANNARFEQATQANMGGTGVGCFSDRMRDAVRGGGAFDGGSELRRNQGFANGLYTLANELAEDSVADRKKLLTSADLIRLGMAANLRDYRLEDCSGGLVTGHRLTFYDAPAGYAATPADVINYVSKHDNQTLWDINQYKIAHGLRSPLRVRMQLLALALPLLSQGIPFLHMGCEILRSKSMERDSFASGDWFNRVDFSYKNNNWNVGLPRQDKDGVNWPVIATIIANPQAEPDNKQIKQALAVFKDFLVIRYSSRLFRLRTAEAIEKRVEFLNTGPAQIPGLLVMSIDGEAEDGEVEIKTAESDFEKIVVVINATPARQKVTLPQDDGYSLHPRQQTGADVIVKQSLIEKDQLVVPALTVAVFVKHAQHIC